MSSSCDAGEDWWKEHGGDSLIPDETWDVLNETDACFRGPTTTPGVVGALRSVAVSLRQRYDLYANVRPIKSFEGAPGATWRCGLRCIERSNRGHVSLKID